MSEQYGMGLPRCSKIEKLKDEFYSSNLENKIGQRQIVINYREIGGSVFSFHLSN